MDFVAELLAAAAWSASTRTTVGAPGTARRNTVRVVAIVLGEQHLCIADRSRLGLLTHPTDLSTNSQKEHTSR